MPAAPLPERSSREAAAPGGWSGDDSGQRRSEIDAEIADHLALSASELARRGLVPEAAAADALRRFGDVASVRRKCWWIQAGDQVMFRVLAGGLLITLILVTLALGVGGWRVQSALANRLDQLNDELHSLGAAQQALLNEQALQPPEIRGHAYLGDPSQPAAGVEVQIWNASDMKIFRRVRTDAEGRFRSSSLPPGDYFVLAPSVGDLNFHYTEMKQGEVLTTYAYLVQSEPLYLYAGGETRDISLDVKLSYGQVSMEFDLPQLKLKDEVKERLRFRFVLYALPQAHHRLPLNPNDFTAEVHWPVKGITTGSLGFESIDHLGADAVLVMHRQRTLPLPGFYDIGVRAHPYFDLGEGNEYPTRQMPGWPRMEALERIEIVGGKRTHLKITLSEEAIRQLESQPEHGEDTPEMQAAFFPRPAKIEVISGLPLLPAEK
ncbi:MAG TPA: carboxypeptidase-like regulatory domain-containing protein [Pirellulales bacterium]